MQNGIYETYVHGWMQFYKVVDDQFFIPDYSAKKKAWYWCPTIVCPERALKINTLMTFKDDVTTLQEVQDSFSRNRRGV